jgi:DNA-binding SARP family transcriptional activator/LysM repeat protein
MKGVHRMRRRPLLGSLAALAAFVAFPLVLAKVAGGPAIARLTTLHALRSFLTASDDSALTTAMVRNVVRIVWLLWAYLALSTIGTGVARVLDRLGHPSLRRVWEQVQPRSVIATANLLLVVGVSLSPRVAQAATRPAAVTISAPQVPETGAASPVVVPASAPVAPTPTRQYVIRHGDTLWEIAARECGSALMWHDVADLNGITDPGRLVAGQQLVLPAACTVAPTLTYVVQERDSLTSIAQREYGRAGTWGVIWDANRGKVMADGKVFSDPNKILPGWVLTLPTAPGSASPRPSSPLVASGQAAPVMPAPAAAPVPSAPANPDPAPAPNAAVLPAPSHPQPLATAEDPAVASSARPASHRSGIELPGGLIAPVVGGGALALVVLARRRRQARLPLDRPEPFRPDGPQVAAIRRSFVEPAFDKLEAHTAGLLAIFQASSHAAPRVVAAWDDAELGAGMESVRFLLADAVEAKGLQGRDPETGVSVSCSLDDGQVVARSTRPAGYEALAHHVPLLIEDLLVPVGVRPGDGWLHVPLLGPAIAVTGEGGEELATGILFAAAQRVGAEDLAVVITDGLLGGARAPAGLDLPAYERLAADQLGGRLASEVDERSRWLAGESGCETFAQACAVSSHPALVLVVNAAQLETHAPVLARLGSLGVGVLVLGETSLAARCLRVAEGVLQVSGPEIGTFDGLAPLSLPSGLIDELETATILQPATEETEEKDSSWSEVQEDVEFGEELPDPAAPVRVHLLGCLRVIRDGEERPKPAADQARELVARLAVSGAPMEAGDLRELLWPDEVDARTSDRRRRSLNSVISRARSWLGGPEHLPRTGDDSYRLADVWVDVQAFRGAVTRGDFAEAVALYAGDLLPGLTWEWVDRARDAERSRYFGAAAGLARQRLDAGDPHGVIAALEPALEGEGGAVEALVQLAMRAESAAGNPDGVRRRLRQLTAALRQDPSAETMGLAAELIASHSASPRQRPPLRLIEEEDELHAVGGGLIRQR